MSRVLTVAAALMVLAATGLLYADLWADRGDQKLANTAWLTYVLAMATGVGALAIPDGRAS